MNSLKKIKDYLLSWIKPVNQQDIVETSTGQCYPNEKHVFDKYAGMAKFYPWPGSYFVLVSVSLKDKGNERSPLLYRFYDPVTNKEFVIEEALKNILFFKQ